MEEVLGKMLAQGIEVWWPEEGDRRKGATAERADERSSSLIDGRRRKEEMTTGAHNQINIWVLPGRTVRRSRADRPEAGCYSGPPGCQARAAVRRHAAEPLQSFVRLASPRPHNRDRRFKVLVLRSCR